VRTVIVFFFSSRTRPVPEHWLDVEAQPNRLRGSDDSTRVQLRCEKYLTSRLSCAAAWIVAGDRIVHEMAWSWSGFTTSLDGGYATAELVRPISASIMQVFLPQLHSSIFITTTTLYRTLGLEKQVTSCAVFLLSPQHGHCTGSYIAILHISSSNFKCIRDP
jgi:hypothetical protein